MESKWSLLLNILYLALLLGIATIIKIYLKPFQKHLVPISMVAGFIGLFLGPEFIGIIKFDTDVLETLIYHLMAIGFISLSLKDRSRKRNDDIVNTGFFIINTYLFQAILGFSISLLLVNTIYPDLFPTFGLLLPLAYAQGPGQAYSVGSQWELYGFTNGGNIGVTIATIGFLWALVGGVPFMNILLRINKKPKSKMDMNTLPEKVEIDNEIGQSTNVPKSIFIDDLSLQLILIGTVYLLTFLFLRGLGILLEGKGVFAETIAQLFWGFHFMIGTLFAIIFRMIIDALKKRGFISIVCTDNYLLQRISSSAFDLMIAASISAISIQALREYLVPTLIITTIGGLATMLYTTIMCKLVYKEDVIEHIVALYGMWTGTITTGIALLKEIDPHSKSKVPEHLVLGSGVAVFLGFPLMLILGIAVTGYVNNTPILYLYTILAFLGYMIIINLLMFRKKIRSKNN